MSLHNFNPNTKSWKMYTNTLTSISGDDLIVAPTYGKDLILEVSANNDIFFKKGRITKNFDSLISDASFNSLTSQVKYILQEISGSSALNLITSGISNDLLIKSYEGQDIILEVSGNSEIIFKRGDISYNLDDLIGGGGSQSSGSSSNIILTSISGNIIPAINNTFKLGDVSKNWSNAYITDLSVSNINGQPYIASTKFLIDYSNSTFSPFGQDLSGETIFNYFGCYVSLSEDGKIMGVTAPFNNGAGTLRGSAQIYKYNDISWVQLGLDIDGEADNDQDFILKLSKDGTIAAIGSFFNAGKGQVRIFKYNDISWIPLGVDIEGVGSGDMFARSISLSSNGKIIAIGAIDNDTSYNNAGQVRVFSYIENDNSWNKIGEFNGFDINSRTGASVSLSSSGTSLAISSTSISPIQGQVNVYDYSNNTWTPRGTTIFGNGLNTSIYNNLKNFGNNIELSSDGSILAIAERHNPLNNNYGRVMVYNYNSIDNSWNKLGLDINGPTITYFEWDDPNITLSSDGTIIAVGFGSHDSNRGLVRLYKFANNDWAKVGSDILGDNIGDVFGYSVSLSSNGSILAVGAPLYDPSFTGLVRTYNINYAYTVSYTNPTILSNEFISNEFTSLFNSFTEKLDISYLLNSVFEASHNNIKTRFDISFATINVTNLEASSIIIETINTPLVNGINKPLEFIPHTANTRISTTISGDLALTGKADLKSFNISNKHNFDISINGYSSHYLTSTDVSASIVDYYSNFGSIYNKVFKIDACGNVTNYTGEYGTISDSRLKENIVTSSPKLEDLLKVRVVNYNLKGSDKTKYIGVLAQELEELFPELVTETSTNERFKSVNYSSLTILLIKAFQEQQVLINNLNATLEELEKESCV